MLDAAGRPRPTPVYAPARTAVTPCIVPTSTRPSHGVGDAKWGAGPIPMCATRAPVDGARAWSSPVPIATLQITPPAITGGPVAPAWTCHPGRIEPSDPTWTIRSPSAQVGSTIYVPCADGLR